MSIILSDSTCTRELHDKVVELRTAYTPLMSLQRADGTIVDVFADIYEAIERVSRRTDGEAAARLALASIVGEALDILSHVSGSPSMDRLKELGDLLKLAP
jgi:hypothetical protein